MKIADWPGLLFAVCVSLARVAVGKNNKHNKQRCFSNCFFKALLWQLAFSTVHSFCACCFNASSLVFMLSLVTFLSSLISFQAAGDPSVGEEAMET